MTDTLDEGSALDEAMVEHAHEAVQLVRATGEQDDPPQVRTANFAAAEEKLAQHEKRLRADVELLGVLQFSGYTGMAWEEFAKTLAEYGYGVVRAWIITEKIFEECARKGVRLPPRRRELRLHEVEELTQDTVADAIEHFRRDVLPRRWTPHGGASLKTFFVGQALFRFAHHYRAWDTDRRHQKGAANGEVNRALTAAEHRPDLGLEQRETVLRAVGLADSTTRQIALLRSRGYGNEEVAELLGLTPRAVEGRLYRLRKRLTEVRDGAVA